MPVACSRRASRPCSRAADERDVALMPASAHVQRAAGLSAVVGGGRASVLLSQRGSPSVRSMAPCPPNPEIWPAKHCEASSMQRTW